MAGPTNGVQAQGRNGIQVNGPAVADGQRILTPEALEFVAGLQQAFDGRRRELLAARTTRQADFDAGRLPDFLAGTANVREGDWQVAPPPADLNDRRVEITGP